MTYSKLQAKFYDGNPPLYPWPLLLAKSGFKYLFKPREIFFKNNLDKLGLEKEDKVLEVGCGEGIYLTRIVNEYKVKGVGVDISSASIMYAEKHFRGENLKFLNADAINLPFKSSSFDYVISFDTLEHIEKQELAIKEMVRVMKKDGKLAIYTLNAKDRFTLDWFWEKLGIDIYSRAKHKRELFVKASWLGKVLKKNDIEVSDITYFDAFFSLAMDELIMLSVVLLKRLGLEKSEFTGYLYLNILNGVVRFLYPVLQALDKFWYKKGYSLSFLLIAKRL